MKNGKQKKINLGCGRRFSPGWINVDFTKSAPDIVTADLSDGIPFDDSSIDFVYSSHVLEHFPLSVGQKILQETYRVLVPGGIIRVVVPDLELLARKYLQQIERLREGDNSASLMHDWSRLALFDQVSRHSSGGEMARMLAITAACDLADVFDFEGAEIRLMHEALWSEESKKSGYNGANSYPVTQIRNLYRKVLSKIKEVLSGTAFLSQADRKNLDIGRFRTSGEVHFCMYDEHLLRREIVAAGFKNFECQTAFSSNFSNWNEENLDTEADGSIYKPASIFVEAIKPNSK